MGRSVRRAPGETAVRLRVVRWEGGGPPTVEVLRERLRAARCSAVEWTDPPGRAHEPHAHAGDEVIALVKGGIIFEIAEVDYPLSPGDMLYLPAGTLHAAQAHPTEGATYLIGSRGVAGRSS